MCLINTLQEVPLNINFLYNTTITMHAYYAQEERCIMIVLWWYDEAFR